MVCCFYEILGVGKLDKSLAIFMKGSNVRMYISQVIHDVYGSNVLGIISKVQTGAVGSDRDKSIGKISDEL